MKNKKFEDGFDKVFKEYDKDNSGTIDKNEMKDLLNRLLGGTYDSKKGKCLWIWFLITYSQI